jgi:site-specific DNA-methyltransferase (adenine-specific)
MKPYYEQDGITIYHGDCREILTGLGAVQGVVTDPPFGIGFKYASHDDTPEGYGVFVWGVIESAERLCDAGSPVFVWQAMPNVRRFHEWFPREWRIFAAAKNFVQMRPTAMQYAYDPVLVWWVGDVKPWSDGTTNRDFHVGNTAGVVSRKSHERGHPCPRPLDQVEHIISQWVKPGGTVLDPFMGSGTTLLAAKRMGCKAIGIEIEERYCEIAVKRLAQSVLPLDMTG